MWRNVQVERPSSAESGGQSLGTVSSDTIVVFLSVAAAAAIAPANAPKPAVALEVLLVSEPVFVFEVFLVAPPNNADDASRKSVKLLQDRHLI